MVFGLFGKQPDGFRKLSGDSEEGGGHGRQDTSEPDPDVVAAHLEYEERRKEKYRRMEAEREKMRRNIREKYNIKTKDNANEYIEGRLVGNRKTPEQVALEQQQAEDSIVGQLGLTEALEKAKTTVNGAVDTVKDAANDKIETPANILAVATPNVAREYVASAYLTAKTGPALKGRSTSSAAGSRVLRLEPIICVDKNVGYAHDYLLA
ncbi:synaphin protein [Teladorsagia circumcincta]|uniref:Synaphin protein n=1 Tax=Teladorsagia circumcincta TaxID=45464 RepID=A0A2G9V198_TELCI|nr:synaphin protein [Teladorsagia circumcincta]